MAGEWGEWPGKPGGHTPTRNKEMSFFLCHSVPGGSAMWARLPWRGMLPGDVWCTPILQSIAVGQTPHSALVLVCRLTYHRPINHSCTSLLKSYSWCFFYHRGVLCEGYVGVHGCATECSQQWYRQGWYLLSHTQCVRIDAGKHAATAKTHGFMVCFYPLCER